MVIQHFYDPATFTLTYVVFDEATRDAVVIDPVLDFDPASGRTSTASIEAVEAFLRSSNLRVHVVFETHAHADHLSGSQYLRTRFGAQVAIGARITEIQEVFKPIFAGDFATDGSQFDRLLAAGEVVRAGSLAVEVLATPGHTPACVSLKIGDAVFTGDALFLEDYGTGRCDFPKGDANDLYTSVHDVLYALPDETRVFVGHDYQPNGREMRFETTIGVERRTNVQLHAETTRDEFVAFRRKRDAGLAAPRLLYPSVQVNVDAGRLPKPDAAGQRRLQMPLNLGRAVADDGTPLA
jgi:glyoxylase-like metal-dependent hydrolase (beta-lactamase superfamily II)